MVVSRAVGLVDCWVGWLVDGSVGTVVSTGGAGSIDEGRKGRSKGDQGVFQPVFGRQISSRGLGIKNKITILVKQTKPVRMAQSACKSEHFLKSYGLGRPSRTGELGRLVILLSITS